MAGKFLLIEEAATRLGMTVDEVQRLVDRKKLFPLRDGATIKFKVDDVERLSGEIGDEPPASDAPLELALDEDLPTPGTVNVELLGGEPASPSAAAPGSAVELAAASAAEPSGLEIDLGDDVAPAASAAAPPAADDELARTMLGTGEPLALDSMELDLESVVGFSAALSGAAPASGGAAAPPSTGGGVLGSGTLDIDLSNVVAGSSPKPAGSRATDSLLVGSDALPSGLSGPKSGAGAALSDALDSGLSLEDADAAISGIDLSGMDDAGLAEDGATALAGEEFDMGDNLSGLGGDDDSASVVAVEDSGESSFFDGAGGESSEFSDVMPGAVEDAGGGDFAGVEAVPGTRFSLWQVVGLVCCTLLLLTGGFVMFDLMRTIGSAGDLALSSPLLNPLASLFGWR